MGGEKKRRRPVEAEAGDKKVKIEESNSDSIQTVPMNNEQHVVSIPTKNIRVNNFGAKVEQQPIPINIQQKNA